MSLDSKWDTQVDRTFRVQLVSERHGAGLEDEVQVTACKITCIKIDSFAETRSTSKEILMATGTECVHTELIRNTIAHLSIGAPGQDTDH